MCVCGARGSRARAWAVRSSARPVCVKVCGVGEEGVNQRVHVCVCRRALSLAEDMSVSVADWLCVEHCLRRGVEERSQEGGTDASYAKEGARRRVNARPIWFSSIDRLPPCLPLSVLCFCACRRACNTKPLHVGWTKWGSGETWSGIFRTLVASPDARRPLPVPLPKNLVSGVGFLGFCGWNWAERQVARHV